MTLARLKKRLLYTISIPIVIALLCLVYGYFEARNIKLSQYTLSNKNIPQSFEGKKIVFITDIHFNKYFDRKSLTDLVARVNDLEPDVIILGGDYVDKRTTDIHVFFDEIRNLQSKYGIYSVLGNHDNWINGVMIKENLADCGFNICDNKSYWIRIDSDSIKIGGVGDLWTDDCVVESTISDVKESDFCILLSHNPDYIDSLKTNKVDLMLSGHTHAGQVTFFGLWAPIMPGRTSTKLTTTNRKYRYGWIGEKPSQMYVSSGAGVGSFPLRFFAHPEIVEITLSK